MTQVIDIAEQYLRAADAVTTLQNSLKLSTGSTQAASAAYEDLYQVSKRSRVSFLELGGVYTSISGAAGELGISQSRMLKVTESIANAMTISGGSAQSMNAALGQLSQGMAFGSLRGEGLSSILEQTPRLAKALADGLGVSIEKLREMGDAGEISSQQIVMALESQSAVLSKEVTGTTLTLGQALNQLADSGTKAVGEFDKASGVSTTLAEATSSVATAMDAVGSSFSDNAGTIQTVVGALAGAAALTPLAALPKAITAVTTAVAGLSVVAAANPIALALLGVGAVVGGGIAAVTAYSKTADGIKSSVRSLEEANQRSEAALQRAMEGGRTAGADNIRKRIEDRNQTIRNLNAELALTLNAGLDNRAEDARLAAGTERFHEQKRGAGTPAAKNTPGKNPRAQGARIAGQMQGAERRSSHTEPNQRDDTSSAEQEPSKGLREQIKKQEAAADAAKERVRLSEMEYKAIGLTGDALRLHNQQLVQEKIEKLENLAVSEGVQDKSGKLAEAYQEEAAALRKLNTQQGETRASQVVHDYVKGIEEGNKLLEAEIGLMGMSEQARATALAQLRIQLDLEQKIDSVKANMPDTDERAAKIAKLEAGAATAKANVANKAFLEEWKASVNKYDNIFRQGFVDMLTNGKEGWKNFTKSLATTFKTTVADQIYKTFAQPFVVSLVGSLMGLAGPAGASVMGAAGSSALSMLGTSASVVNAGSALGGLGSIGGAIQGFGTALTASVQSLVGISGTTAQMVTSLTQAGHIAAPGMATGMNLFSAIPGWGWALAGIALLGSMLSKKQTPHSGAGAVYSSEKGLQEGAGIYNLGTFGMGDVREYNKDTQSLASGIASGLGATFDGLAKAFGKKAGFEVATAFADDTSKDGAWGSLRISQDGKDLLNWDDTRTSRWAPREFADGEAGQKEYMALIAKDTRQVLLDMDLPSWADKLLTNIGEAADMDKLSAAVQQIGVIQTVFVDLGRSMEMFSGITEELQSALLDASGSVEALSSGAAAFYEGFYSEEERMQSRRARINETLSGFDLSIDPAMGEKAKQEYRAAAEAALASGNAELAAALLAGSRDFAAAADYFAQAGDAAEAAGKRSETAFSALERAVGEHNKALQSQLSTAQDVVGTLESLFGILHDNVRELYGEVDSTRGMQVSQGNAFIDAALATARKSGYLPDADKLAEAIGAVRSGIGSGGYVSQFAEDRDRLVLAGKLSGLEAITEKQLTDAQRTVRALETQIEQGEQTLDYWRQQIEIASGTYEGILSVEAAVQGLQSTLTPTAGKPGGANTVGGGSSPAAGAGVVARANYGADEALTSFEKFKAWYNGIRSNADPSTLMDPGYQVPDWMRFHNGADDGTDQEQFGSYLFFKNNPQYAKDLEQIYSTGRSSYATDGSTLVKSDLSKMPKEVADFYRGNTPALLGAEGFGLDPVLAYQLYNYGPQQFGLDGRKQSFTEWLQTHAWTEQGLVDSNNVVNFALQDNGNYKSARWQTSTGNIIDTDGTVYTKDGKRLRMATDAEYVEVYGAGKKPEPHASSGRDDYLSTIRANTDDLINKGWTAQQLADALVSTNTSLSDIAAAYDISVDQVRANLIAGGATNIPHFAEGTNYVSRNTLAYIHEGEAVVPKAYNPLAGGAASDSNAELVAEVRALRQAMAALQAAAAQTADNTKLMPQMGRQFDQYSNGGQFSRQKATV